MVARALERRRAAKHGLVKPAPSPGLRLAFAALVALSLVSGIAGGLLRAGVAPFGASAPWLGQAAVAHGALMVCGFFGAVIGIERAVALKRRWAFGVPLLSALATAFILAGQHAAGAWFAAGAALLFTGVNAVLVRSERAPHTWLLFGSAASWFAGCVAQFAGASAAGVLALWFAFLVGTIAAERLEMTRLMRRRPGAQPALVAVLLLAVAGAFLSFADARAGGVVYGAALVLLALWLAVFDIARRTFHAHGLSRYMAVCLLSGYGWLATAGIAWAGSALGLPWRDAALHALGLGFVFSMVMGHAPVILPAVARVKLAFGPWFYLPLVALHATLAWRLGADQAAGASGNALAIAAFALVAAVSAWGAGRSRTTRQP
jgi:hypothetical protein